MASTSVFGEETAPANQTIQTVVTSTNKSRFHLFTMNCKGAEAAGPESTPQSPPLVVDDPATPGCNRWEVNVVVDGDISSEEKNYELPLLDLNYGIGDNLQLKFEIPYSNTQISDTRSSSLNEFKAGIKLAFFNDEASEIDMALYPQITFIRTTDESEKTHQLQTLSTLPLLFSKKLGENSLGDISLTANLSYTYSKKPDTNDFMSAAVGIGMPLTKSIGMMGELATDQAFRADEEGSRSAMLKANFGLVTTISKNLLFFGSIGHSLYSSDSFNHQYAVIGFRILTGSNPPNSRLALVTNNSQ